MNFKECVLFCAGNKEPIKEFDRLSGTNLSFKGAPINLMVDEATGKLNDDLALFTDFVYDCIWTRLGPERSID